MQDKHSSAIGIVIKAINFSKSRQLPVTKRNFQFGQLNNLRSRSIFIYV